MWTVDLWTREHWALSWWSAGQIFIEENTASQTLQHLEESEGRVPRTEDHISVNQSLFCVFVITQLKHYWHSNTCYRRGCQTFSQRQTLSSQWTSGAFVEFKYRDFFLKHKLTSFLSLRAATRQCLFMQSLSELNDVLEITDWRFHWELPVICPSFLISRNERLEKLFRDISMEGAICSELFLFLDGLCFNWGGLSPRIIFRYNFNMLNEK